MQIKRNLEYGKWFERKDGNFKDSWSKKKKIISGRKQKKGFPIKKTRLEVICKICGHILGAKTHSRDYYDPICTNCGFDQRIPLKEDQALRFKVNH